MDLAHSQLAGKGRLQINPDPEGLRDQALFGWGVTRRYGFNAL